MRKVAYYFLTFTLILSFFPQTMIANGEVEQIDIDQIESIREKMIVITENENRQIEVYRDENGEEIVDTIQHNTIVDIKTEKVTTENDYIFIYYDDENEEKYGYVHKRYLYPTEEIEADKQVEQNNKTHSRAAGDILQDNEQGESEIKYGLALKQPVFVYEEQDRSSNVIRQYDYGHELKYETYDYEWHKVIVIINGERKQGYIHSTDVGVAKTTVTGIAANKKTNVYKETDAKSVILKSYDEGHLLKYRAYKKGWLSATVVANGKRETGYIRAQDVETVRTIQQTLQGISVKNNLHIYDRASKRSKSLRTYREGYPLKFKSFTKNWYEATIILNGKHQTGYIYHSDVELAVEHRKQLEGVSIKRATNVYSQATRNSTVLRSYKYGQILKYRSFTKNWYEATIILNGKRQTGYIHESDVASLNTTLTGYAYKNPTVIYENMSTSSNRLREYSYGAKLSYMPYTSDWFKATVIIDDIKREGYIQTKDVGPVYPVINGYAHGDPTIVYENTSKNAKRLKTYVKGARLKYRVYNTDWYEATVIKNGKHQTGYIHKDDVGENPPSFYGYGTKSPTVVYASPSRNDKRLKTYRKGSRLKYQLHSKNWYRVTIIIDGKRQTGYIHKNDIGKKTDISFVNPMKTYTYETMVNDIKNLQKAYPDLITYHVVGKSEYGRDIYAVSLGKGKATTFINGSLHAREWISTNLNMYMLENYAKAYTLNRSVRGYNARQILNKTTIWFMPMVNPDGVTLQQRGLGPFPKKDHNRIIKMNKGSRNFKRWKANAKGVDINRNFSVDWHYVKNNPKGPSYQSYKGYKPLSSKEAQTVVKLVQSVKPQMTVNYHSSGRVIYWQYKQRGAQLTRDRTIARQIGRMTGYQLLSAGSDPSGGGFLQWFTVTQRGPSITPELAPYTGPTNVPLSRFSQIWRENEAVGLYAAEQSYYMSRK